MALEVQCKDLGLVCRATVKADSEDELVQKVAEHARDKHDVELTETLVDYAKAKARS